MLACEKRGVLVRKMRSACEERGTGGGGGVACEERGVRVKKKEGACEERGRRGGCL